MQTLEGELRVEIPQVRAAAEPFVSKLFPCSTKVLRTDIESLCEKAGLGKLSKSTAQRICTELRERFEVFKRRDLYDVQVAALFLDAVFLPVRPEGPKEGVLVAWGFTEQGERVLLAVMLGMRESHEDWLELGRDLIARGLGAPLLVVADGAPGLIKAVEQCWPASDRQHCCVHRVRNLLAKLPERERERVRAAYWQALDDAIDEPDGKQRRQALVAELEGSGYTAAAKCLADDLDALVVHLRYPTRHRRRWRSTNLLERSLAEVKRRTKVIGRFPGKTSCLTLVWAVLDLYITHAKNGVRFSQLERQHLRRMRQLGDATPERGEDRAVERVVVHGRDHRTRDAALSPAGVSAREQGARARQPALLRDALASFPAYARSDLIVGSAGLTRLRVSLGAAGSLSAVR